MEGAEIYIWKLAHKKKDTRYWFEPVFRICIPSGSEKGVQIRIQGMINGAFMLEELSGGLNAFPKPESHA
jgi:hypothetical protein